MHSRLLIMLIAFLMLACGGSYNNNEIQLQPFPPAYLLADTADGTSFIAILKSKSSENIKLTSTELITVDSLLKVSVNEYNVDKEKWLEDIKSEGSGNLDPKRVFIDLRNYKRQYVAYLNENGEREVWINCFCLYPDGDEWKTKVTQVNDGGICYFHIKINLINKTSDLLSTNGSA